MPLEPSMFTWRTPPRPGRAQCTHPVPQAEPLLPHLQSNGGLVTRLVRAESLSCLLPTGSPARRRLPSHGSRGPWFSTFLGTMRRYDCHPVPLGALRLSLASRYLACFGSFVVSH